jgi:tetrathionate reductase subunit B
VAEKRYAMVIDIRRCIGCHACSVACKAEMAVPLEVYATWLKIVEKGVYPDVRRYFLPRLCNNCEEAICARNCPTKATYKRDDGIVAVDQHRCIGCKYCIASCPYDVRYINPLKNIVQKCYFCSHRLDAGLTPACVETCPTRAMVFGDRNDSKSEISQVLAANATNVLKAEMQTEPQVFYISADESTMGNAEEEINYFAEPLDKIIKFRF